MQSLMIFDFFIFTLHYFNKQRMFDKKKKNKPSDKSSNKNEN